MEAVAAVINHADVDVVAAVNGLENGPLVEIFGDMGADCGPTRASWAFSQVLVRVSQLKPATYIGRYAQNEVLKGLCPDPGQDMAFTLDRQAQTICAGR